MYSPKIAFLEYASDIDAYWCLQCKKPFSTKHSAGTHCSLVHRQYIDGKNSRAKLISSHPTVPQRPAQQNSLVPSLIPSQAQPIFSSEQEDDLPVWVPRSTDSWETQLLRQALKRRFDQEEQARLEEIRYRNSPTRMREEVINKARALFKEIKDMEDMGLLESITKPWKDEIARWGLDELEKIRKRFPYGEEASSSGIITIL